MSVKAFLVSGYEVGFTNDVSDYLPRDGAKLSYFESGTGTSADNKRIAYLNGLAGFWWLRSPYTRNDSSVWNVHFNGYHNYFDAYDSRGIRPALILPSTSIFDSTTYLLKG